MDKRNIIDRAKKDIEQARATYNDQYVSLVDLSDEEDTIERVFHNEEESDFSNLGNVSEDDYSKLLDNLVKDDHDLRDLLEAAHYVVKYDIGLADVQIEALEKLVASAKARRKEIGDACAKKEIIGKSIKALKDLKDDLDNFNEEEIIDIPMLDMIFDILSVDEETKAEYLEGALLFNLEVFSNMRNKDYGRGNAKDSDDSIEVLDDNLDSYSSIVSKFSKKVFNYSDLKDLFDKYGYDLSAFHQDYVDALLKRGSLAQYISVFEALKNNKVPFAVESDRSLTQFLIYSKPSVIEIMCNIFRENGVNIEDTKGWFTSFFPGGFGDAPAKGEGGGLSPSDNDNIYVRGTFDNFIKNYQYIKENFQCDMKSVLEKSASTLISSHKTFVKNVSRLKLYKIFLDEGKKMTTLTASRPMDNADRLIEVGEEDYIYRHPTVLTRNCDLIARRIYVCKERGYDYHSKYRQGTFVTGLHSVDKPFVLPSEAEVGGIVGGKPIVIPPELIRSVPDYAIELVKTDKYKVYSDLLADVHPDKVSNATYDDPVIKNLDDNYMKTQATYVIDGTIISRNKLLRNYEFLKNTPSIPNDKKDLNDILLVSAISNSLFSESEVNNISKALGNAIMPEGGSYGFSTK